MPNSIASVPRLFADDTCIILHDKNLSALKVNLDQELHNLHQWCIANTLTINPLKCDSLVICPQYNNAISNFSIILDNCSIEVNEKAKYLGVLIDSKLNFQQHLNQVENKVSRAVGIMFKLKSVLPQEALLKLYYALVHPYLLYGI